ncbi:GerAB/ArcD/ProY family transporter [Paenibacillus kobensis]|uniref:GerAB/ArcD/ProY family transporter n=1 Tax=Paenibacillus kobensis TaxID=59841 RepID=UPI000FDB1F81|nr:endospore germination permease [Paenibacillus kobensis]
MQMKEQISAFQMALMMYPTVLATGFLALPSVSAHYAGSDMWLAPLFASFSGFLGIFCAVKLHQRFPGQTVVQYGEQIVGRWLGKLIGLGYFIYLAHRLGTISRQYAEFVEGNFLFRTPNLIVICTIVLLAGLAVRGGIEVMARSAVIFTPIFIFPIFFLLLLFPDLNYHHMFPVLDHGLVPVLQGSIAPQAWFNEYFLISFILPKLANAGEGGKWGYISFSAVLVSLVYVDLICLFLLGEDTGSKTYPVLVAFRFLSVADLFENLEALLLAMWVFGNFVKISVFYYAAVTSFTQCLNLQDYRVYVLPVGIIGIAFSLWDLPTYPSLVQHLRLAAPFEILLFLSAIPLLLLIIAALSGKSKAAAQGS